MPAACGIQNLRPSLRDALAELSYFPSNRNSASHYDAPRIIIRLLLLNSFLIWLQNAGQAPLFIRARRAFKMPLPPRGRRSVQVMFAVDQLPWTVLPSVLAASAGIMLLQPTSQIIGMPDVKSARLDALQNVDAIHRCDFPRAAKSLFQSGTRGKYRTCDLPQVTLWPN